MYLSAVTHLAAGNAGPLNMTGIKGFLLAILGILVMLLAIRFIGSAHRGQVSKVATSSGIAVWGIILFTLAAAGTIYGLANGFGQLVFK